MTAANFPAALAFTLQSEGGYVDNPADPGGATNKGITLATFRTWEGDASLGPDDIRAIDDATVAAIYKHMYWDRLSGDTLPAGIDLMLFDFGVNAGPGRAARMLQAACEVAEDGIVGPDTLAKAAALDAGQAIAGLAAAQRAYYQALPTFGTFGRGWLARTDARVAAARGLLG